MQQNIREQAYIQRLILILCHQLRALINILIYEPEVKNIMREKHLATICPGNFKNTLWSKDTYGWKKKVVSIVSGKV